VVLFVQSRRLNTRVLNHHVSPTQVSSHHRA
jgi:hypothetical protein